MKKSIISLMVAGLLSTTVLTACNDKAENVTTAKTEVTEEVQTNGAVDAALSIIDEVKLEKTVADTPELIQEDKSLLEKVRNKHFTKIQTVEQGVADILSGRKSVADSQEILQQIIELTNEFKADIKTIDLKSDLVNQFRTQSLEVLDLTNDLLTDALNIQTIDSEKYPEKVIEEAKKLEDKSAVLSKKIEEVNKLEAQINESK